MFDPKLYFARKSINTLHQAVLDEMREKQRRNVAGIAVSLGFSSTTVEAALKDLFINSPRTSK